MISMAKWLNILLIWGLLAIGNHPVYRLLLNDGQVIAYTEFEPHVGDYYWQAEENKWYVVVRVEADIGWLELTEPPTGPSETPSSPSLLRGTLVLSSIAIILFVLTTRRQK